MSDQSTAASFEQVCEIESAKPTLVEGLPGHGLVASIAVDQITDQLELDHCGNIASEDFPPVVTFEDGLVQDLVRVYAGSDPDVMTLESDLALPPTAFEPLTECVLEDLAEDFGRAIFLAGAPAETEAEIGEVTGVATTEPIKDDLVEAGVSVPDDPGLVGGITGALVRKCYQADVPAALLIVRSHPFLPDPRAAKSVIENALEPLVEFDIDTTQLEEQAEEIQQRMQQVAQQYQQMAEEQGAQQQQSPTGMFQ
ncbi:proteasome assembly chaperone family protein [Natrialbaceae archaeon AArc-T1-2]|uniref:proteasome assembly chaperone family protein n=1 Tax=Natrialbaceae archaeon AArc-T1-2 TaxID=3053904 RepID=UPI00255AC0E6|nr:PAC2 family protein [Natrialbaceae archaeon AArc-T1-2]WIV66891.1 PAC2 family protein [Natrialbaceae archaeon AArc-T1-2]